MKKDDKVPIPGGWNHRVLVPKKERRYSHCHHGDVTQ